MLPPGATATVDNTEAEVTTEPAALVLLTTTAGATVDDTTVEPWSFVVVTATTTLVGAVVARALVVCAMTLPTLSVVVVVTGTRTPVSVEVPRTTDVSVVEVSGGGTVVVTVFSQPIFKLWNCQKSNEAGLSAA